MLHDLVLLVSLAVVGSGILVASVIWWTVSLVHAGYRQVSVLIRSAN